MILKTIFSKTKRLAKFGLFVLMLSSTTSLASQDITSGLLLHYKFETVKGTSVTDASGNHHGGIKLGAPMLIVGASGYAARFTAQPDYIKLPNNISTKLTDFSVSAWVKLDQAKSLSHIFDVGNSQTSYMYLTPLASGAGAGLRFTISKTGGKGEEQINGRSPLPTGIWVNVAVTLKGTVGTLYVNGKVVGTNPAMTITPAALGATTLNYIAKPRHSDTALAGSVDEFRIYNRALSGTDISLLKTNITPRYTEKVSIFPTLKRQVMEGWGGSLCWWANLMGGFSDTKVKEVCDLVTDPTNGLNMNIFRFNIGGGDDPTHTHLGYGKNVPGYKASATAPYDWNQDANQRKILKQLIASRIAQKGVNDIQLIAFSNSPPYWMTNSGCVSGHEAKSTCNLQPTMFVPFADYLTEVVKHYHDSLGITFNTVEPFNEPYSDWWTAKGGQEGCYFGQNDQHTMIHELYTKLVAKNMTGYCSISAMDANNLDDGYVGLKQYIAAGDIVSKISRIDVHSYEGKQRKALATLAASIGKKVWQSESGPLWTVGSANDQIMAIANRIVTDIKELKCPAWIDWQIASDDKGPQWGLFVWKYDDPSNYVYKSIAYYIRAQFSRYIKQGYIIIDNNHDNVLTAISPDEKELVVTLNNADIFSRKFEVDLSAFTGLGTEAKQVRTIVTATAGNIETTVPLIGSSISCDAPAGSVTTYIITINRSSY